MTARELYRKSDNDVHLMCLVFKEIVSLSTMRIKIMGLVLLLLSAYTIYIGQTQLVLNIYIALVFGILMLAIGTSLGITITMEEEE